MKITFLLPSISQALAFQRVQALQRHGVQTDVLAFEREAYLTELWENCYTPLGTLPHRRYGGRPLQLARALPAVRAAARDTDVLYATALDMLLLGWLATRGIARPPRLVFDVFDIRDILTRSHLVARLLRYLERRLLQAVDLLVVTSQAYVSGYFQDMQKQHDLPYLVIENKLDPQQLPPLMAPRPFDGVLRIGYFGKLRCGRSWEILQAAARAGNGYVHVLMRGIPRLLNLVEEAQAAPHVTYGGPYVSPRDLPQIYSQVDMVWATYPFDAAAVGNWRWARTHRFYEACYFRRPLFTQASTEDGLIAARADLGLALDLSNIAGSVQRILQIGPADLSRWQQNIQMLPTSVYTHSNEYAQLHAALSKLVQPGKPAAPSLTTVRY